MISGKEQHILFFKQQKPILLQSVALSLGFILSGLYTSAGGLNELKFGWILFGDMVRIILASYFTMIQYVVLDYLDGLHFNYL